MSMSFCFLKEQPSSWACSAHTRRRCRSCFSHRRGRRKSTSPLPSTSQWFLYPSPPKRNMIPGINIFTSVCSHSTSYSWSAPKIYPGIFYGLVHHDNFLVWERTCRWSALITASPASLLSIPRNAYLPPSFTFTPTLNHTWSSGNQFLFEQDNVMYNFCDKTMHMLSFLRHKCDRSKGMIQDMKKTFK